MGWQRGGGEDYVIRTGSDRIEDLGRGLRICAFVKQSLPSLPGSHRLFFFFF